MDAMETLKTILEKYSSILSRNRMDGSMIDTISSLSFALGIYSSQVTRMYRQDYGSLQYKNGMNPGIDDSIEVETEILTSLNLNETKSYADSKSTTSEKRIPASSLFLGYFIYL